MYYRDHQDFENLKREYKASRVTDEIERAKQHIGEVVENLSNYIHAAQAQLEVIKATTINSYVSFSRRTEYRTNRISYEVGLMKYPDIERGQVYQWTVEGTCKVFTGREKKDARKYAESLAKEHSCKIVG